MISDCCSHPLTADQVTHIDAIYFEVVNETFQIPFHFDRNPLSTKQGVTLADAFGLTAVVWQNLPRLRVDVESLTPRLGIADVISLQVVRNQARRKRIQ